MKLRDELEAANNMSVTPGGQWTITSTSATFPQTLTVNNSPATYADDAVIPGGDNPDVTWTGHVTLTFKYTTTTGTCTSTAYLTIDQINRVLTLTGTATNANIPFVKGLVTDPANVDMNNVTLSDSAKQLITQSWLVHNCTLDGVAQMTAFKQSQTVKLTISRANLPAGSTIKSIALINNYGSSNTITIPDTSSLNIAGTAFSPLFVTALNSYMDFNTITNSNGSVIFDPQIVKVFGKLIVFGLEASNTVLTLTIPLVFLPATYTGEHYTVDVDNTCLYSDNPGVTAITFTNTGLTGKSSNFAITTTKTVSGLCSFISYTANIVLTWVSAGSKSLLGNGKFLITDNSFITPATCNTTTLVGTAVPAPVNPTWIWTLPSGLQSQTTTSTLTVATGSGLHTLDLLCTDCKGTLYTKSLLV